MTSSQGEAFIQDFRKVSKTFREILKTEERGKTQNLDKLAQAKLEKKQMILDQLIELVPSLPANYSIPDDLEPFLKSALGDTSAKSSSGGYAEAPYGTAINLPGGYTEFPPPGPHREQIGDAVDPYFGPHVFLSPGHRTATGATPGFDAVMAYLERRLGDPTFKKVKLCFSHELTLLSSVLKALEEHNTVAELDLSGNGLDSRNESMIVEFLGKTKYVQHLNLCGNQLNRLKNWLPAVQANRALTSLNVSSNRITDVAPIAAMLENVESALTSLNLSQNEIDTAGARILFSALGRNNSLRSLDISRNKLKGITCNIVAACLESNRVLNVLGIKYCGLEDGDANVVVKALEKNTSLVDLGGFPEKPRAARDKVNELLRRNIKSSRSGPFVVTVKCVAGKENGTVEMMGTNMAGEVLIEVSMQDTDRVCDLRVSLMKTVKDAAEFAELSLLSVDGQPLDDMATLASICE